MPKHHHQFIKGQEPFVVGGVPFDEAIQAATERNVVLPDIYYGDLKGIARSDAFSVAGVQSVESLTRIKDNLQQAINRGESFQDWKDSVNSGSAADLFGLPDHRLRNIFRTNIQGNYLRGRARQIIRTRETRPFLLYSAINDDRVRPSHIEMDGTVLPISDPWWDTHYPPNGYQCRCSAVSLSVEQANRRGITAFPAQVDPDVDWDYSLLKDANAQRHRQNEFLQSNLDADKFAQSKMIRDGIINTAINQPGNPLSNILKLISVAFPFLFKREPKF